MLTHSRDALQAVKSLAFQRIPVAITGTYKGLFFEEKVAALKVGPDAIIFKAPRPQLCLLLGEQVWLHSQLLPQSVRATLLPGASGSGEITLTNFSYTGAYWRDRLEQRIEPNAPVRAMVTFQKKSYPANLTNLSLHGAGLLVYLGDDTECSLSPRAAVEVCFTLSEENDFHLLGSVVGCRQMGYSVVQLGVRMQPTRNQVAWLENYIARRKIEILRELDEKVAYLNRSLPDTQWIR
ncbi:PilZ domain-containing protein [bacterium]|nr:PilZ domain-containing protein [bacterium]